MHCTQAGDTRTSPCQSAIRADLNKKVDFQNKFNFGTALVWITARVREVNRRVVQVDLVAFYFDWLLFLGAVRPCVI